VPFTAGDAAHPASEGPDVLVRAGVERLLADRGVTVHRECVEIRTGMSFPDVVAASAAVNRELQAAVRRAVAAGRLPIVVAGSCDAAIGVVSGLPHRRCGIVWVDAHGDFNTPDSSVSGFFPGMSLAIVTGHCYQEHRGPRRRGRRSRPLWRVEDGIEEILTVVDDRQPGHACGCLASPTPTVVIGPGVRADLPSDSVKFNDIGAADP